MATYFLKFSELNRWGAYGGITEIEAYMGTTKVPLTALFATSEYDYNWLKEKLVDGNTTGGNTQAWLSTGINDLQNILLSATAPFDSIKVYAGSGIASFGSPRDVEVSTYTGVTCPPDISSLWVLQDKRTYTNSNGVITPYTHKINSSSTQPPQAYAGGI